MDLTWMAWTQPTAMFFVLILVGLVVMGVLHVWRPGSTPRAGFLGLETTRGDRFFLSLVGTAYICMAWLAFLGTPLWGALGLSALWAALLFWKG